MKTLTLLISTGAALSLAAWSGGAAMAQTGAAAPEASAHNGNGIAARGAGATASTMGHTSRKSTQSFITAAAHANQSEIDEARYALDHSSNDQVKRFARRMLDDHTRSLDQLKQLASNAGYEVPSGISSKAHMQMKHLEQDQGAGFDSAYSRGEVRDHRAVIAEFKQAQDDSSLDPAVRRYARETIPTLTEHLQLAQHLVATAGKGNRSAG